MVAGPFDVIVVGARVAGAATAMLLARRGLRVLAVDRAAFPSDTLSSHQVQLPGVARLRRWGLLPQLDAVGTPPTHSIRFDPGFVVLDGVFASHDGVNALYSPRRTLLDSLLVDAARASGAEVRERFRVSELVWSEGRVVGVRGRDHGRDVTEKARLIVGADGKNSTVAAEVTAHVYRRQPPLAFASYSYWHGLRLRGGELYQRPGRAVAAFPTNDDLAMVYVAAPLTEFSHHRRDIEGNQLTTLDQCGTLGARVRSGTRAERIRTAPDQPNLFRTPHGPGWALVGDAGLVMDSISAQGIGNALRDAELLADAICSVLPDYERFTAGRLDTALRQYHRKRDSVAVGMYDFTVRLAQFAPPRLMEQHFLASLKGRPEEISRFLAAFTGAIPADGYFTPTTAARVLGVRGVAGLAAAAVRRNRAPEPNKLR